jgi:lysophospholipase L1-like esterase
MRTVPGNELGAPPALRDDRPAPTPAAGEVLVRVHAASLNPVDDGIAAGMAKDMDPHEFPVTPGRHFAGVVKPVSDGVTGVSAEDEVFGFVPAMAPTVHAGARVELTAIPEAGITRKPDGVDTAATGGAPLAAVTAVLCVDAAPRTTRCRAPAPPTGSAASPSSSPPSRGDHAGDSSGASFQAAPPSTLGATSSGSGGYFVTGVDVYAPNDGLVVGLGDSITVGANASDEGWPYWLADRLTQVAAQGGPRLSIIDMGISGNQVTQDNAIAGASAARRLQRDVLDQTGRKGVLMMEGINDIVNPFGTSPGPGATIESGLAQIIETVRDAGAGILLSPRTPAGDLTEPFPYGSVSTPGGVQERHDVDNWIRHTSGGYSPLFDFEPVIEDPRFPDHLWPSDNSGDSLHPSIAGQRAMADSALFGVLKASQDAERGSCVTGKFAHSER